MKALTFILCAIALLGCGCSGETGNIDVDREYSEDGKFSVAAIDSCEYVVYHAGSHRGGITHKGNCKYCKQRGK